MKDPPLLTIAVPTALRTPKRSSDLIGDDIADVKVAGPGDDTEVRKMATFILDQVAESGDQALVDAAVTRAPEIGVEVDK